MSPQKKSGRFAALIGSIGAWAQQRGGKRLMRDGVLVFIGASLLYVAFLWLTLPDISNPRTFIAAQSSVITDRNGTELYRLFGEQDRTYIPGTEIPQYMKDAIVAIEDARFFEHGCFDVRSIARAVFVNTFFGQSQGASTLTQQLARNALLTREKKISRKIKELMLACSLERRYGKQELLELYLNWIPFGQNVYGVEQASQTYFGIPAKNLSLPQAVILAAIPQRPTYFNPYGKNVRTRVTEGALRKILNGTITQSSDIPDADVRLGLLGGTVGTGSTVLTIGGRTDQVLRNMQDLGYIKESERLQALVSLKTITFQSAREDIRAAHFVLWVKQQVQDLVGTGADENFLDQGGLTIETTLDWKMQQVAEQAITSRSADLARIYGIHNAALVAADPRTGEILAYVGNSDYNDEKYDGKVDMARAPRQPGSSFKPFVYAAAFERGFGPATPLYDVPTKIGSDQPQNFDGTFMGLLTARRALAASRNVPAAKAYFLGGEEKGVLDMAHRLGAVTPLLQAGIQKQQNPAFSYGWPLALGAAETPLTEMVQGYATLAAGGTFRPVFAIRKIKDKNGNIIFEAQKQGEESQAIDPRIAYEITSILSDVGARPNAYWQSILSAPGFQVAAKTGTSNKCLERRENGSCKDLKPSDLWTLGYSPSLAAGVWIGNADSAALAAKAESLTNASPIWHDFMVQALKLQTDAPTGFPMPSGLVQPQVSLLSGELPTECTPIDWRRGDVFLQENAPALPDPACARLTVDRVTGLLAGDECPVEAREERSFLVPQSILAERFPQWQQAVIAWATTGSGAASLPLPLAPTETCRLAFTPGRMEKPTVSITYPQNGDGVSYPSFRPRISPHTGSGIRELRFSIDGTVVATVSSGGVLAVSLTVPRSVAMIGTHTFEVLLTDQYFNTATAEATFRFEEDTSPPLIRLLEPSAGQAIRKGQTVTIRASADDQEGDIKYVQFFLNDQLLTTKPKAPYSLDYKVDSPAGIYTLKAVATDLAGNTAEDSVTIEIQP